MIFKQGDAADAAVFADVKKALAKFAGVNFKHGSNMAQVAIDKLEEPTIIKPANPPAMSIPPTVDEEVAREEWKYELEDYVKKKRAWEDVKPRAFQLVMTHVDPDLEERLETSSTWATINHNQDVVGLLKLIRAHAHQHDEVKQGTMALVEHDLALYLNYQKGNEDIATFHKLFKARCDVIDTFGGRAGYHPALYLQHRKAILATKTPVPPATEVFLSQLTQAENNAALESSCEEYKAALFIRIANERKYGVVEKNMDNMHLFDQGAYPKTLEKARAYLENFQAEAGGSRHIRQQGQVQEQGVAFMQKDGKQLGPCHNCNKMGHLVRNCPDLNEEERMAVLQAMKNDGRRTQGQTHVNVDAANAAKKELQECIDGVANIHINLEDASIESVDDDDGFFEGVALLTPTGSENSSRLNCGRNKLFLDSCATQHTMFAQEYLDRQHTTGVYLRQNCNAGSKLTNKCG